MRRDWWLLGALAALTAWPLAGAPPYLLGRAIEVFMFAILALSYDLLIGFTGIVSFGHALFFGAGAYALALLLTKLKLSLLVTVPLVMGLSALLAVVVGALSLRVKGHFFAMITLAFAELGHVVVQKWYRVTGGADGLSIAVPKFFYNKVNGYFVALGLLVLAYAFVRRVTNSPAGKVFAAIRENEFRAAALGFNTTGYKVLSMALAGVLAGLSGAGYALMVQQGASPDWLGPELTIQALLMTIIGGVGTLEGPMIGAAVIRLLSTWLASLRDLHPVFARWPLVFGLVYIAIVMFLPAGIVGTGRMRLQSLWRRAAAPGA